MLRYSLRRLFAAIPTLLGVTFIAFLMMHAAPGGPFDRERVLPPELKADLEAAYGLDKPLPEQFMSYLGGVIKGDFGPSFRYREYTVTELIALRLPQSLTLGALAMLLAVALGMTAGTHAALNPGTWFDRALMTLSLTGLSIPVIIVAPLLILVFSITLGWLPAGWSGSGPSRYVLPVIALALPQLAYIARLMRGSLIEVLSSDFIRTARAQGLKRNTILLRHAFKPALLPLLSYLGPALAGILGGSVIVEQVFAIPGIGQLFITGSSNRDYTLVLGIVIFYAALVIAFNFIVDILYGFIDPRIRYS